MNRKAKAAIDNVVSAYETFQKENEKSLLSFRWSVQRAEKESEKYRDAEGYIAEKKKDAIAKAREELGQAESAFRAEIRKSIDVLKTELSAAITAPIADGFAERIALYRSAALAPSRSEVEALLTMAGKNPVAVRAVAKLLDDTSAPVKVTTRQIDEFESDVAALEDLSRGPLVSSPYGVHSELCAVVAGQPKPARRNDGEYIHVGHVWDSLDLTIQRAALASKIARLREAADSWGADVSYQIAERLDKAETAQEKQAAEDAHEEFTPRPEPTSTTGIEKRGGAGVELAASIGREKAADGGVIRRAYASRAENGGAE